MVRRGKTRTYNCKILQQRTNFTTRYCQSTRIKAKITQYKHTVLVKIITYKIKTKYYHITSALGLYGYRVNLNNTVTITNEQKMIKLI